MFLQTTNLKPRGTAQGRSPPERGPAAHAPAGDTLAALQRSADQSAPCRAASVLQLRANASPAATGSGAVVQRAYDDTEKQDWPKAEMRKIWTKLRTRTGAADSPLPASGDGYFDGLIGTTNMTERQMAERLIELDAVKALLMPERDRRAEATAFETLKTATKGDTDRQTQKNARGNRENIISAFLRQSLYYHVTFTKYADSIRQDGLKADRGGSGTGVSTHGRSDARGAEARTTYNKWSKGFVFVTNDASEAKGYLSKLKEKEATEGKAQMLHVFVPPGVVVAKGMVDADSTGAAIKLASDTPMIGDGTTLNAAALESIAAMLHWEFKIRVRPEQINKIYARKFPI